MTRSRLTDRVIVVIPGTRGPEFAAGARSEGMQVLDLDAEVRHRAAITCPGLLPVPRAELVSLMVRTAAYAPQGRGRVHLIVNARDEDMPELVRHGAQTVACEIVIQVGQL